jgi:HTH-type transcriptional regulator/antitoxin HigA
VQLSLRGKTDDRFWFTLFHELAHVLLHGRGEVFIERRDGHLSPETQAKEDQANDFAADLLIPKQVAYRLSGLRSLADVRAFAAEIDVSPGVVVGRLHNDGTKKWSWGAGLKARMEFAADPADAP